MDEETAKYIYKRSFKSTQQEYSHDRGSGVSYTYIEWVHIWLLNRAIHFLVDFLFQPRLVEAYAPSWNKSGPGWFSRFNRDFIWNRGQTMKYVSTLVEPWYHTKSTKFYMQRLWKMERTSSGLTTTRVHIKNLTWSWNTCFIFHWIRFKHEVAVFKRSWTMKHESKKRTFISTNNLWTHSI